MLITHRWPDVERQFTRLLDKPGGSKHHVIIHLLRGLVREEEGVRRLRLCGERLQFVPVDGAVEAFSAETNQAHALLDPDVLR